MMNDNSDLIDKIEKEFAKIVKQLQRALLAKAISGLLGYALDRSRTTLTVANIRNTNRIAAQIRATGRRERKGLLQYLIDALISLFDKNKDFYQNEGSTQSIDDAARKRILLLYGYDVDKNEIIEGSYLDEAVNMGGVAQQVGQLLNREIAARASLPQLRKALRLGMGGQGQGLAERHFQRFTRDLFAEYDRTVKLEYKERLELRHAIYAGTEIATTRDFCDARINNVYTEQEILTWNSEDWQGKKPGDVRIVCGGYNCRHHLNWVSEGTALAIAEDRGGLNNYN